VITRLEVNRLSDEIERIDKNAFIFMHSIKDTRGGMVKKLPLKKIKSSSDSTIKKSSSEQPTNH
jgi:uncharacterized protein YebE (UPF0316 family)